MYRLFIANKNYSSWSLRPWVLLRALDIPFEEVFYAFEPGGNHARFSTFSPTGTVPCLHDAGQVVWDSLAIAEYLAERQPAIWPADAAARAWSRCVCAEIHAGFGALRSECSMSVGHRIRLHAPSEALQANLARLDALWQDGLERHGGPWLGGAAFSAADAFYAPVAFRVQTYGLALGPVARGYCDQLLAHPVMQAWQRDALAETLRDAGHEAEMLSYGTVIADLRAKPA